MMHRELANIMRITILNQAIDNHDNRVTLRDTIAAMLRSIAADLDRGRDSGHILDTNDNIIGGYDIDGN